MEGSKPSEDAGRIAGAAQGAVVQPISVQASAAPPSDLRAREGDGDKMGDVLLEAGGSPAPGEANKLRQHGEREQVMAQPATPQQEPQQHQGTASGNALMLSVSDARVQLGLLADSLDPGCVDWGALLGTLDKALARGSGTAGAAGTPGGRSAELAALLGSAPSDPAGSRGGPTHVSGAAAAYGGGLGLLQLPDGALQLLLAQLAGASCSAQQARTMLSAVLLPRLTEMQTPASSVTTEILKAAGAKCHVRARARAWVGVCVRI